VALAPQKEGRVAERDQQLHELGRREDREVARIRRDVGDRDSEGLEGESRAQCLHTLNSEKSVGRTGKSGLVPGVVAIAQIHCRVRQRLSAESRAARAATGSRHTTMSESAAEPWIFHLIGTLRLIVVSFSARANDG